jgi:hypothetical protein
MELPIEIQDLPDAKIVLLEKVISELKPETKQRIFSLDKIIDKMTIETRKLENKEINENNLKVFKLRIEENIKNMIESLNFVMKQKIEFVGSDLQTEEAIRVSLRKNMLKRIGNLITRQVTLLEEEGVAYEDLNWPQGSLSTLTKLLISGVIISPIVIGVLTAIIIVLNKKKSN